MFCSVSFLGLEGFFLTMEYVFTSDKIFFYVFYVGCFFQDHDDIAFVSSNKNDMWIFFAKFFCSIQKRNFFCVCAVVLCFFNVKKYEILG